MCAKTVEIALPNLHPAQAQIKAEARRFNVLNCGRRFGKDILGHELIIDTALDGFPVAWFAPTYRMMLDTFRDLSNILRPIATKINASDHRIELLTKGVLDFWSLDVPDVARGRKYKRAIINEAAMVPPLENAWNMVIRPTLADYEGDAFFLSTPKGLNFFRTIYQRGQERERNWISWHQPTGANPFIKPGEIEAMRAEMTSISFRQEVLAEFLEGEGQVFRNVRAVCTIVERDDPAKHAGHTIIAGVDWGKSNDYTRIRVGCRECGRVVDWDGFNRIDYHFQRERIRVIHERWHVQQFLVESNSIGTPNLEELQRDGLPARGFETTATSKPPLIENLALAIERSEWQLPQEDANELEAYELKQSANTGRPTYSAPQGGHDDRVIADSLMLWASQHARLQVFI